MLGVIGGQTGRKEHWDQKEEVGERQPHPCKPRKDFFADQLSAMWSLWACHPGHGIPNFDADPFLLVKSVPDNYACKRAKCPKHCHDRREHLQAELHSFTLYGSYLLH